MKKYYYRNRFKLFFYNFFYNFKIFNKFCVYHDFNKYNSKNLK